jgi:hypothetical protein
MVFSLRPGKEANRELTAASAAAVAEGHEEAPPPPRASRASASAIDGQGDDFIDVDLAIPSAAEHCSPCDTGEPNISRAATAEAAEEGGLSSFRERGEGECQFQFNAPRCKAGT